MAVPAPTGTFVVHRPGLTDAAAVKGNADYRPLRRLASGQGANVATGQGMTGLWQLQLDTAAWPVSEADTITHVESGRVFSVRVAAPLRGFTGRLAHIAITADLLTNDRSDTVIDSESGEVLAPAGPVQSPAGTVG